ncbi:asparaginase [Colletotrichum sojae]|uniref:asparaginase n=1 Tax=Colletotrichum sojae TaxID=2175907 RepID=A0A8H6IPD5_9PEZI|nr:asparaginase [Colletotrichum sojae]
MPPLTTPYEPQEAHFPSPYPSTPPTTPPQDSKTAPPPASNKLGRIAFVGTGGTMGSWSGDEFDLEDYNANEHWVDGSRVVRETGVDRLYDVRAVPWAPPLDSTALSPGHWRALASLCVKLARDRSAPDGIVIGHGTASLEETAWVLSLVLPPAIPVVVTGSMRPLNGVSSDAAANLLAACHVAAYFARNPVENPGVVVVANHELHSPRTVTKTHTLALGAFRSPSTGPFGHVDGGGRVRIHARPWRPSDAGLRFEPDLLLRLKRVDVVYSYIGADGAAVDAFVAAGARGIVSAGFGPGLGSPAEIAAFERAIGGDADDPAVCVVQSSRLGDGRVVDSLKHRRIGIVAGADLNPQKARILLALCLTAGQGIKSIRRAFDSL